MDTVNKPEISRSLAWLYAAIATLIPALGVIVAYFPSLRTPSTTGMTVIVVLVVVIGFVEIIMLWILASIYRTRYILTEDELILKAPRLIGGRKRIPLETINSVERTLIPFGFRLFGASFYGGYYYLPSVGKAFMVITNFKDGVLVKAKHGNYVITPSNPERFIETIEKMTSERLARV
jgi:membrane protein YdbS with pleckstrin-like domain